MSRNNKILVAVFVVGFLFFFFEVQYSTKYQRSSGGQIVETYCKVESDKDCIYECTRSEGENSYDRCLDYCGCEEWGKSYENPFFLGVKNGLIYGAGVTILAFVIMVSWIKMYDA